MSYNLKKDHLKNWDAQDKKPSFNDDEDPYISERSSTASLNENTPSPNSTFKRLPTPPPNKLQKNPHSLRYHYNELPENGIPLATQVNLIRKEEKKRKKAFRKAPPGRGNLIPLPETNPTEQGGNYYPYAHYYQAKNPDWMMRHRQTADGQLIPYDSVDPSQYALEPALATPQTKTRRHHRKSNKKSYETALKTEPSSYLTSYENYGQQRPSSKQFIPLKYADNEKPDRKLKTEHDWNGYYVPTVTRKSPHDPNNLITTPRRSKHRSKHHSKKVDENAADDSKKHHHHHHHHSPPETEHTHHHIHPPEQHHHHSHSSQPEHHHHHHHDHPAPSKEYVDAEFQVIDASFKKAKRTPFFQPTQNSLRATPPAVYKQSSYLPPITRDYYYRPNLMDYSTISSPPKFDKESLGTPKIYKPDPQTRFYDRYLNNVIEKRLAA